MSKQYPATRAEAKATGSKYYFTGEPCKHGHTCRRHVSGKCMDCREADWKTQNANRKGKPKTEAAKAAGRRYYKRNRELVIARAKARPAEEQREHKRKHKERNPERYKAYTNSRRRRLKDATPRCQTPEQRREIREMYAMALRLKEVTGINYEVDHIVPLCHQHVSGLHVPWNLQILTDQENGLKNNSFIS